MGEKLSNDEKIKKYENYGFLLVINQREEISHLLQEDAPKEYLEMDNYAYMSYVHDYIDDYLEDFFNISIQNGGGKLIMSLEELLEKCSVDKNLIKETLAIGFNEEKTEPIIQNITSLYFKRMLLSFERRCKNLNHETKQNISEHIELRMYRALEYLDYKELIDISLMINNNSYLRKFMGSIVSSRLRSILLDEDEKIFKYIDTKPIFYKLNFIDLISSIVFKEKSYIEVFNSLNLKTKNSRDLIEKIKNSENSSKFLEFWCDININKLDNDSFKHFINFDKKKMFGNLFNKEEGNNLNTKDGFIDKQIYEDGPCQNQTIQIAKNYIGSVPIDQELSLSFDLPTRFCHCDIDNLPEPQQISNNEIEKCLDDILITDFNRKCPFDGYEKIQGTLRDFFSILSRDSNSINTFREMQKIIPDISISDFEEFFDEDMNKKEESYKKTIKIVRLVEGFVSRLSFEKRDDSKEDQKHCEIIKNIIEEIRDVLYSFNHLGAFSKEDLIEYFDNAPIDIESILSMKNKKILSAEHMNSLINSSEFRKYTLKYMKKRGVYIEDGYEYPKMSKTDWEDYFLSDNSYINQNNVELGVRRINSREEIGDYIDFDELQKLHTKGDFRIVDNHKIFKKKFTDICEYISRVENFTMREYLMDKKAKFIRDNYSDEINYLYLCSMVDPFLKNYNGNAYIISHIKKAVNYLKKQNLLIENNDDFSLEEISKRKDFYEKFYNKIFNSKESVDKKMIGKLKEMQNSIKENTKEVKFNSYSSMNKDVKLNPFLVKDGENIGLLMQVMHSPMMQKKISEKLGVNITEMELTSQIHLLRFFLNKESKTFDRLKEVLKNNSNNKENILKSFLACAKDKKLGDVVLDLAEKGNTEIIFEEYAKIVNSAEESAEELFNWYIEKVPKNNLSYNDFFRSLLTRANDLLSNANKKNKYRTVVKNLKEENIFQMSARSFFTSIGNALKSNKTLNLRNYQKTQEFIVESFESQEISTTLLKALQVQGSLSPIPEIFWVVDRSEEDYNKRIGFDFSKFLEKFLNYKKIFVEFGSGNGTAKKDRKDKLKGYSDFSISDKLYYPIRPIIRQIIDFEKLEKITGELSQNEKGLLSDFLYKITVIKKGDIENDNFEYDKDIMNNLTEDPNLLKEALIQKSVLLNETNIIPNDTGIPDSKNDVIYPYKIEKPNNVNFSKACKILSEDISSYFIESIEDLDIYNYIPAYSPGSIISDFSKINNLQNNQIDIALGIRSTVYLEGSEYEEFMINMKNKLTKDGIYIDDNVRENHGRYYRLDELKDIQKEINTPIYIVLGSGIKGEDFIENRKVPLTVIITQSQEKIDYIRNNLFSGYKLIELNEVLKKSGNYINDKAA